MRKTQHVLSTCSVTFARSYIYKYSLRIILVDKGYTKPSINIILFTIFYFEYNKLPFGERLF